MEELKSEKPFNTDAHVGWLRVSSQCLNVTCDLKMTNVIY